MDPTPRLYPRGFLLTPSSRQLPSKVLGPRTYPLEGYTLHCEELTELDVAETAGAWVVVVGKAWPLSTGVIPSDARSLAAELLGMASHPSWKEAVDEALYDVGGRYAILIYTDGTVTAYNDACGNRSVYFSALTQDVASHFELVRQGLEDTSLDPVLGGDEREDLAWETTRSPHVHSLIPNHRAHVPTGTQTRFFPLSSNRAAQLSSDARLDLAQQLWAEQLSHILTAPSPKIMSMTAGLDSRTLLALAVDHREKFTAFTYTTTEAIQGARPTTAWSRSSTVDVEGVRQLKTFLPNDFRYIAIPADKTEDPGTPWVRTHINTLVRNTERSHNRRLLPRYLEAFPDPRTIHYRGNMLEIGRLHLRTPEGTRTGAFESLITSIARRSELDVDVALRSAADACARLGYEEIPDEYDLTDIFYWEQRHGRWFARVLNETDVVFDTVSPFNVRRMIDLFLAYSIDDRANGFAQKELIYRAAPFLTFIGINGEPDLYRQFVSNGQPAAH